MKMPKMRLSTAAVLLVSIIIVTLGVDRASTEDILKISVYYETYCPDSIDFIKQQLAPMMGEFNRYPDWLIIDLLAFGKAKQEKEAGNCKSRSQHGPKETLANILNACAIESLVTNQIRPQYKKLADFIYCTMLSPDQVKAARKCASQTDVNYTELMMCYESEAGCELLDMYANRTAALLPPLSWVPTIVFNDIFNQTRSDLAQSDLYGLVCRYNPDECQ